jgi:type I restriction enzyme M protein
MTEDQRNKLKKKLWDIANELRGKMGADEFKDYILGFIFYKYLSERITNFVNKELANDNLTFADLDIKEDKELYDAIEEECKNELGYFLPYTHLFSTLVELPEENTDCSSGVCEKIGYDKDDTLELVAKAFDLIEKSTENTPSEDDFINLFEDVNLNSTKLGNAHSDRNTVIVNILEHLDGIDFDINNPESDILGDAYEYLIGQFAAGAGKKGGEFYTPSEVSTLLAKIVTQDKPVLKSVYDAACGSGSLLLKVKKHAKEYGCIYGQELNRTTYNLARMNMLLHDVKYQDFDIKQGDTLVEPRHKGIKFDAIVANPPFSAQWNPEGVIDDDRFTQYGKTAPKSKADYAFIQHMIHSLNDSGTFAVVVPHGVLFRGAAEGHIRQYLIENKNYLEAVIGLPSNLFYGTSIPACILVFKKCREDDNNVLFIDASKGYESDKNQNKLRPKDINDILKVYKSRKTEDKYSYLATLKEIKENEYNLNIPRYVDTFEEEEIIDLDKVKDKLKDINDAIFDKEKELSKHLKALGL